MAGDLDLEILQGHDYEQPLKYKVNGTVVDLSAYTALAEVKRRSSDEEALLELNVELASDGWNIILSADGAATADMTWRQGVWDLMLFPASGPPKRLLAGQVTLVVPVSDA